MRCIALLGLLVSVGGVLVSSSLAAAQVTAEAGEGDRLDDPVTEAGQSARGLYLGSSFVRAHGAEGIIRQVRSARMNAVVLDLKDAEGHVHHDTSIPALAGARTGDLGDARALVAQLREEGIYTIARIVCFADRSLPSAYPERAIQRLRSGRGPWVSWGTGGTWLDPYNAENHALVVALAQEAAALGFAEIQLDYVRFPVDNGTRFAAYPAETDETRTEVLLRLLRAVDEAVSIPLGVDVFGLAALRRGDPSGLGQDLERWAQYVEIFTPMLYVNSMRAWRRGEDVDRTFRLVFHATRRLRNRLGPRPVIRPFLQAFERGAENYGPEFIFEQVRAARARGRLPVLAPRPHLRRRAPGDARAHPQHRALSHPRGHRTRSRPRRHARAAQSPGGSAPVP